MAVEYVFAINNVYYMCLVIWQFSVKYCIDYKQYRGSVWIAMGKCMSYTALYIIPTNYPLEKINIWIQN